jgi:hypothetical protein
MLSSSAANSISRTVLGLAHTTTTARKEPPHQQSTLHIATSYKTSVHEVFRPNKTVDASVHDFYEYKFQLPHAYHIQKYQILIIKISCCFCLLSHCGKKKITICFNIKNSVPCLRSKFMGLVSLLR